MAQTGAIFALGAGAVPGYVPAVDDSSCPFQQIQYAYAEMYGLKKYIPTIMQPKHFSFEDPLAKPTYYSFNYPSTLTFSPSSRKASSILYDMEELIHIINVFQKELMKENNVLSDTIISDVAKNVEFHFFHNENCTNDRINHSNTLITFDDRFSQSYARHFNLNACFSSDAPFLRGCIALKVQNKNDVSKFKGRTDL